MAEPVIFLFDGVCGLCNRSVDFILKHDRKRRFKFAALQSPKALELLRGMGLPPPDFSSSIVLDQGQVFMKSEGFFRIMRRLGLPWAMVGVFRLLPRNFRDRIYDGIASRRYRIFGKLDQCRMPTPQERERFLE